MPTQGGVAMRRTYHWIIGILLFAGMFCFLCGSPMPSSASAGDKQDYNVAGEWVEGCSCTGICTCEMTGLEMGCAGVGAMKLASGSYMGTDLSGVKIAYATMPGHWVRLYVDAANSEQRKAAEAFARAVYTPFGKIE